MTPWLSTAHSHSTSRPSRHLGESSLQTDSVLFVGRTASVRADRQERPLLTTKQHPDADVILSTGATKLAPLLPELFTRRRRASSAAATEPSLASPPNPWLPRRMDGWMGFAYSTCLCVTDIWTFLDRLCAIARDGKDQRVAGALECVWVVP